MAALAGGATFGKLLIDPNWQDPEAVAHLSRLSQGTSILPRPWARSEIHLL